MSYNFNLNLGGLGGGAFKLDPSKFNFSAYNAPKKETVVDPVDVVSDNTPTPEVEVLEGAGTVAVTKQAPIVPSPTGGMLSSQTPTQPIDYGLDFGIAPIKPTAMASNPVLQKALEEIGTVVPVMSGLVGSNFSLSGGNKDVNPQVAGMSLFTSEPERSKERADYFDNLKQETLKELNLDSSVSGIADSKGYLENRESIDEVNSFLSNNKDQVDKATDTFSEFRSLSASGVQPINEVLSGFGLPEKMYVTGKYGGADTYTYNEKTNQYEKTFDGQKSTAQAYVGPITQAIVKTAFTAGLGTAVAPALATTQTVQAAATTLAGSGATAAQVANTASAIGTALSTAGLNLAAGDDLDDALVSGVTAGVGEFAKGTSKALESANEAFNTAYDTGVGIQAAQVAVENADMVNEVARAADSIIKLGQAIDQKNILGGIDSFLTLSGNNNVTDSTARWLEGNTPIDINNVYPAASAITTMVDGKLKGDSTEEIIGKGLQTYVSEGGSAPDINIDYDGGDSLDLGYIEEILKQGAEWVGERVDEVKEGADLLIRALPTTKEDWKEAEDVIKEYAEPAVTFVRETGRDASELASEANQFVQRDIIDPVEEKASEINKEYVKPVVEDARAFVDPLVTGVRETGRAIEEGYGQAEDFVKEEVAPVVREFGRDIRNAMPEVDGPDISFPDIDLGGLFGSLGGLASVATSGGGNVDPVDLVTMQLTDPELIEGFEYDQLYNPLLRG